MKKKLLMIVGMLGICAVVGLERPVYAYQFCSDTYCDAQTTKVRCQCPIGTPAAGTSAPCPQWRATCYYL